MKKAFEIVITVFLFAFIFIELAERGILPHWVKWIFLTPWILFWIFVVALFTVPLLFLAIRWLTKKAPH